MAEVEETLKRLQSQKGVIGVIIMDSDGRPIRSTMEQNQTLQYANLLQQLTDKSKQVVRELDPSNDLQYLRLRSKKHELLIAPEKDYYLVVVRNPVD